MLIARVIVRCFALVARVRPCFLRDQLPYASQFPSHRLELRLFTECRGRQKPRRGKTGEGAEQSDTRRHQESSYKPSPRGHWIAITVTYRCDCSHSPPHRVLS